MIIINIYAYRLSVFKIHREYQKHVRNIFGEI